MDRATCLRAVHKSRNTCTAGTTKRSSGFAASHGCFDYSIDVSGVPHEISPPRDKKPPTFPPALGAPNPLGNQHKVVCSDMTLDQKKIWNLDDFVRAADAYCQDGR